MSGLKIINPVKMMVMVALIAAISIKDGHSKWGRAAALNFFVFGYAAYEAGAINAGLTMTGLETLSTLVIILGVSSLNRGETSDIVGGLVGIGFGSAGLLTHLLISLVHPIMAGYGITPKIEVEKKSVYFRGSSGSNTRHLSGVMLGLDVTRRF